MILTQIGRLSRKIHATNDRRGGRAAVRGGRPGADDRRAGDDSGAIRTDSRLTDWLVSSRRQSFQPRRRGGLPGSVSREDTVVWPRQQRDTSGIALARPPATRERIAS